VTSVSRDADVLVIGAGPGGTTAATFLAKGGLRVAVVEREAFPRFKVGESLIPTCMDICKRLGVLDRVLGHGFQVKYGATFHDQELDLETAMDMIADRVWTSRDRAFVEEQDGKPLMQVRTIAHLGGATLDNEENYLMKKLFAAGLGMVAISNQARI